MPNTAPTVDTPDTVSYILEKAKDADAHVYVVGSITMGLEGHEPTDIDALYRAGIRALSDDGIKGTSYEVNDGEKYELLGNFDNPGTDLPYIQVKTF